MKTIRKKWFMPFVVFAVAIGGAFATQANVTEDGGSTIGYLSVQEPCDTPVVCGSSGIPGCTVPGGTAYGMENNCTRPLFKPN